MNSIVEIANRLSSLCTEHKFVEAYSSLFSEHAVSTDPIYKNEPLTGLSALIEREKNFLEANKVNKVRLSEPIFAGSYFSVVLAMGFTSADQTERALEELCVYKVENGKIVSQQFFIG
ncbi:hypothetical protein JN11_03798 [Mucilaginibacter frigoritolerans]|jgi:hypothetical protein|uniref:SnoaL-like domain-containing protein n=1 Tax=Mucilaginibacter frigoritolerans TaxID=652788 RepID=A0A562TUC9_9SPHI|nr:SnoaL-like domain-containing protein [Mucilaginibacter frigoritolerans]TWI96686.1 hypothetical protein JN11_03798 [Mucilaginibacter frigoritolerans]